MHCQHCGLINAEDDHRCLRCGRRLKGVAIAAPASYSGANALALSPAKDREIAPARGENHDTLPLFQPSSQKVIPFDSIQRSGAIRVATAEAPVPAFTATKAAAAPRGTAKKNAQRAGQGNFDFRPDSPQGERVLATGVPAQVYGDGRVAPPVRRMTAGAMDVSMVLLGFGVFTATARFGGSAFGSGKAIWILLAVSLILISLFYGLLWAIARRETAGMHWTHLHLVTFDGSPLDGRNRTIRFVSAWLSYCSGGLGLLWALADEENLAFHDHISKTYPAEKPSPRAFVRQRG
jgi:uncharacterized RDD family membrane protein YckC